MTTELKTGLYRHYKGGFYTVIGVAFHYHTREPLVLYVSHDHGSLNVRPLRGTEHDPDGFLTPVFFDGGKSVERFKPFTSLEPSPTEGGPTISF
jgi:hypothetical protein